MHVIAAYPVARSYSTVIVTSAARASASCWMRYTRYTSPPTAVGSTVLSRLPTQYARTTCSSGASISRVRSSVSHFTITSACTITSSANAATSSHGSASRIVFEQVLRAKA